MRVVLLHSALGDSRLWCRQVTALAGRVDVVAPDLPGYGETPMPKEPFSFIDSVTPHLPGALVGNSMGGMIALRTALAHPELVQKLVLVDAGLPDWQWTEEIRDYWSQEEQLFEARDLDGAVEVALEFWLPPAYHDEIRPQLRRAFELQSAHEEPELVWPELPPLSELAVPTLVVVGSEDKPDFIAIAQHLAEQIPNAELAVVEGSGHLVGVEAPDALNGLLLEFLGA